MTNLNIVDMYSRAQEGGELPYFIGKQTGSSWFRNLGRFAIPILKKLGLSAAKAATGALAATATDVITGKNKFLPSLKQNTMSAVSENLPAMKTEAVKAIESISNRKRVAEKPPKHKKSINKRRRTVGTIFHK